MVLWGFRWFKLFLNPYADDEFEHISESDRRVYIVGRLEHASFSEWSWVIIVAGVGFFTDAYSIFAINMVVPMLGIIYYGDAPNNGILPHNYETALSVVTLGGSIIGQIGFGIGADIWGRRKMYGLELIITIGATLGVVMSSNGTNGSMSIIVWLLVWRFILGIGIGADYPLSAVICAEFAPNRLRGKMLTTVFMCQPLGQLAATLVTLIALVNQRNVIPADAVIIPGKPIENCGPECLKTMDSIWRWVIGVGVIPAIIALWFRLTIIESPRYTADVARDSRKAASELNRYLLPQMVESATASATSVNIVNGATEMLPLSRRNTAAMASEEDIVNRESAPSLYGNEGHPNGSINETHLDEVDLESTPQVKPPPEPSWQDFKQYFWYDGNLRTLIATSLCWFCVDLPFYGLGMNSPKIITRIWYGSQNPPAGIYNLMISDVWQSLAIVSVGAIVGCTITFVAIDKLGRRNIQIIGFFWLFILFVIIGGSFNHLVEIKGQAAIVVLYILCQIFFNFGPNTITYIISAELFPTRYRGFCHGFSAAAGKLGSVIAQVFLAYVNYGSGSHIINYMDIQLWLPYSLLIFSTFMLLGLAMTILWIPGAELGSNGEVKTLEQWEVGRDLNGFAETRLARLIAKIYRKIVMVCDKIYLTLDRVTGGEEAEMRVLAREQEMAIRQRQESRQGQQDGL